MSIVQAFNFTHLLMPGTRRQIGVSGKSESKLNQTRTVTQYQLPPTPRRGKERDTDSLRAYKLRFEKFAHTKRLKRSEPCHAGQR